MKRKKNRNVRTVHLKKSKIIFLYVEHFFPEPEPATLTGAEPVKIRMAPQHWPPQNRNSVDLAALGAISGTICFKRVPEPSSSCAPL